MSCKLALLVLVGLVTLAVGVPVENTVEDVKVESFVANHEKDEAPLEKPEDERKNNKDYVDAKNDELDGEVERNVTTKNIWRFRHSCSNPRQRCYLIMMAGQIKQRCYVRTKCCGRVCRFQPLQSKSCGSWLQVNGCFYRRQCFWYRTDYYYKN